MIVCADDFGLAPDIDHAIIELARLGRISAVSCMAAAPAMDPQTLRLLAGLSPPVDLGLHLAFNHEASPLTPASRLPGLTDSTGGFHRYATLVRRCLTGRVEASEAARETLAQYTHFIACAGRAPDFVDGHLHVQQLPGLGQGIVECLSSLEPTNRPYVRNSAIGPGQAIRQRIAIGKTLAIGWPGVGFRRRLLSAGLATNTAFGGIYAYRHHRRFPSYLCRFAAAMDHENDLLMVHPGQEQTWRRTEYLTLRQADWLAPRVNRFRLRD